VLLGVGTSPAKTFDELFEGTKALPWEDFLGADDAFPVKGHTIRSQLHSVPDCQSIIKKAVVDKLRWNYECDLPETGPKYQIRFSIINDVAELFLDTTGAPLYKRGYKQDSNDATLRETLAASMVKVARYRGREPFIDPFCGSGTIAIEAAMAALNIAPGARRSFDAEAWEFFDNRVFAREKQAAIAAERYEKLPIVASDLDKRAVAQTRENARRAGVLDYITVEQADAAKREYPETGTLIANPPYGVRMLDIKQARLLAAAFGAATAGKKGLKKYIISADNEYERAYGPRADKKRKLYNGMIQCNLYMYYQQGKGGDRR
jgi:putative N6-adenine-specific DNA methylase